MFSDPAKSGPGIWFLMHTMAASAVTDELKRSFIIYIDSLCNIFKCKTCQVHFRNFIDTHNFQNYWSVYDDKRKDIGFFKWTWELHNEVNIRLSKKTPLLEEAYNYYTDQNIGSCTNCGKSIIIKRGNTIKPVGFDTDIEAKNPPLPTRTLAIPYILTLYQNNTINSKPFKSK